MMGIDLRLVVICSTRKIQIDPNWSGKWTRSWPMTHVICASDGMWMVELIHAAVLIVERIFVKIQVEKVWEAEVG